MTQSAEAGNDELLEKSVEHWQARLGREVSRDEANRITGNLVGFFSVLAGWSHDRVDEQKSGIRVADAETVSGVNLRGHRFRNDGTRGTPNHHGRTKG
jgi:hypothetical protein